MTDPSQLSKPGKELADRLEALWSQHRENWRTEQEPHNYEDGTKHFNHVRYTSQAVGDDVTVEVASYVTPDLGELLCLLHNNLPAIIGALRSISAQSSPDVQELVRDLNAWVEALRTPSLRQHTIEEIALFNGGCVSDDIEKAAQALHASPPSGAPGVRERIDAMLKYCDWLYPRIVKYDHEIEGVGLLDNHVKLVRDALGSVPPQDSDMVAVPKAALAWLFGEGPDNEGKWFGAVADDIEQKHKTSRLKPAYWWRGHFRKLIGRALRYDKATRTIVPDHPHSQEESGPKRPSGPLGHTPIG